MVRRMIELDIPHQFPNERFYSEIRTPGAAILCSDNYR